MCMGIILSMPITAFAASYTSEIHFKYRLVGKERSFDAGNIKVTTKDCKETIVDPTVKAYLTTFIVDLYKVESGVDKYIGTFNANRVGTTSHTFKGVKKGKYYLVFSKAQDARKIDGNLTIKNVN